MFTVLTSKLFAGSSVVLAAALVFTIATKNHTISDLETDVLREQAKVTELQKANATLATNQVTLESAVTECSVNVKLTAAKADQAAAAGTAALAEVRKNAGRVDASIKSIEAMPAQTCADAEAILRAGARP